jgi:hypothetical protein
VRLPPYTREREFYRHAEGYDLAQDHRWDEVDPSGYYPDPTLQEWPHARWSPVRREDFNPAGLPPLNDLSPPRPRHPGVVPGVADRDATHAQDAPVSSGRRVQHF